MAFIVMCSERVMMLLRLFFVVFFAWLYDVVCAGVGLRGFELAVQLIAGSRLSIHQALYSLAVGRMI